MMPFECLTEQDKDLINTYIGKFGEGYDDHPTCRRITDMEYLLRFWNASKKKGLFKLFGGKLILEKEISFQKSPYELADDIFEAFGENDVFKNFQEIYSDAINRHFEMYSDAWHNLNQVISSETLGQNSYNYIWRPFSIELPDSNKPFKIAPGMKPMKILHRLAQAYGFEEEFEEFRIAHSMMLNQKSLTGTLCLSIHPLDYMTMSDNDMDWDSCMNWREPGEYRQGTIEMMNSETVIVAYLKSKTPFEFSRGYEWNNKRWRTLAVVNDIMTINVKGYPYQSDDLNTEVQNWIVELAKENLGINYVFNYLYDGEYIFDTNLNKISDMYFMNGKMYSDFGALKDDAYHSLIAVDDNPHDWPYQFHYSGESQCMWCGEPTEDIEDGAVICNDCSGAERCEYCGYRTYAGDLIRTENGDMVCQDCFNNHYSADAITGEYVINSLTKQIYLSAYKEGFVPHETWRYPSIRLRISHTEEEYDKYFKHGFKSIRHAAVAYNWGNDYYDYVSVYELTDDGLELFEIDEDDKDEYAKDQVVPEVYNYRELLDFLEKI